MEWMLRTIKLKNLTACIGYTILLSTWMDDVISTHPKDASPVNGMDAVNYKQFRNLNVCFGYPILLSSGMDAVNSPNPDGCLLLSMGWML